MPTLQQAGFPQYLYYFMAFGFEIEKKDYILFIGFSKNHWVKTARYIFNGWTNEKNRKICQGDIDCFCSEVASNKVLPELENLHNLFKQAHILYISSVSADNSGYGTPKGALLKIPYYFKTEDKPEKIETFLKKAGITVYRAEPFIKPIKTIWQLLKEKDNQ
jgi:hypothetical protein